MISSTFVEETVIKEPKCHCFESSIQLEAELAKRISLHACTYRIYNNKQKLM
jgi:hypothetical protein